MRFTRLNADGTPAAPPMNGYVTRKVITLQIRPSVQAAAVKSLVGACDSELIAVWNQPPIFMGNELSLAKGLLEPALEEMMTGGAVILDDSTPNAVPIGVHFPDGATTPPPICVEAWSRNVLKDHAPSTADIYPGVSPAPPPRHYPFTRYLWPMTFWAPDNTQLDADFQPQAFVAAVQGNLNWGIGPWGDQPWPSGSQGFYVFDTIDLPAATGTYISSGS
jgi:hypothetical protein